MSTFLTNESSAALQPKFSTLSPLNLLPDGNAFEPHKFADQWLLELQLLGDAQVRVSYQEITAADRAVEEKTALVPLRAAVTRNFLYAYQSKVVPTLASSARCESWIDFPYRNRMRLDFSLLRVNDLALSNSVLTKLQMGIPPDYRGEHLAVTAEKGNGKGPPNSNEDIRSRAFRLLDAHQADLALLFAGLPTFDTVLNRLLVELIMENVDPRKFHEPVLQNIDNDIGNWYVNSFTTDARGRRTLVSSKTFSETLRACLLNNEPPGFSVGGVGFFTRPDTVQEVDSLFVAPIDESTMQAMDSAFNISNPTTNYQVRRQFLDDLAAFRYKKNIRKTLEPSAGSTAEEALALRLSQRFSYLFDLYVADREPSSRLSLTGRNLQRGEDRLLGIIMTHPSKASRERLMNREGIPHVYEVMLEMEGGVPQKWPAAMVIKQIDQQTLFLYSLEGGLQRFDDFSELMESVNPSHEGRERRIKHIDIELIEPVFEAAAKDLLRLQHSALEAVLKAPEKARYDVDTFAEATEAALKLPMLALDGPLIARVDTLFKNSRPIAYKTASVSQKKIYRLLEVEAVGADESAALKRVQTLLEFAREKINAYLRAHWHVDIDPDPDKSLITLFQGGVCRLAQSRMTSLTQLMLDNLRPRQYPNAMRELLPVQLVDEKGRPIVHPVTGCLIVLNGPELAEMAKSLDIGGSYQIYLTGKLGAPDYKQAWWNAYKGNMSFKCQEAMLRSDEASNVTAIDRDVKPAKNEKLVTLWWKAVLSSASEDDRAQVGGRKVYVYGLLLGGTVAAGNHHGTMGSSTSVDGVLIFSDQKGPDIEGTVGVYFPDSPDSNDYHEFPNLGGGIAQLLQLEIWRDYFSSRIATNDPEELNRVLGQRGGAPLVRGSLITGNLADALYAAHIKFLSAYANHRSASNRQILHQTIAIFAMTAYEALTSVASSFAFLRNFFGLFLLVSKTGRIPLHLSIVKYLTAFGIARRPVGGIVGLPRSRSLLTGMTARLRRLEVQNGQPLEQAVYSRYAVVDRSVIHGSTPDAGGFYRPTVEDVTTGTITARPVYLRQPDGTVFRVHDNTRLNATEATLVDPNTGLSIHSSGVMRSTVARMSDGEWRAVGFGFGGGGRKRSRSPSPQPGPSRPAGSTPARSSEPVLPRSIEDMADLVERSGEWDYSVMDMVPEFIPNLPSWPRGRGLVIIDERRGREASTMRFVPQTAPTYRFDNALNFNTDVVLRRRGGNHYELLQANNAEPIQVPRDGDCFFRAVALGLNALEGRADFSVRGLRVASARYIRLNSHLFDFIETRQPLIKIESTLDNLLGRESLELLSVTFSRESKPNELFLPLRLYLGSPAVPVAVQQDILREIAGLVSDRPRFGSVPVHTPYTSGQLKLIRSFLGRVLAGEADEGMLSSMLADPFFELNRDLMHILLEYGLPAGDLLGFYPRNPMGYVLYEQKLHGELGSIQRLQRIGGKELVYPSELKAIADRLRHRTGEEVKEASRLMGIYRYEKRVWRMTHLLLASLRGRPAILARAELLLASQVISANLGGQLPVAVFARWVGDTAISSSKLTVIAKYSSSRLQELLATGNIDIQWTHLFSHNVVRKIVIRMEELVSFFKFLKPSSADVDMPALINFFSAPGERPVGRRVDMLLSDPTLLNDLRSNFTPEQAERVWGELISLNYSNSNILHTLRQQNSLASEADFTAALIVSLADDARSADQIVASILADQTIAADVRDSLYQFVLSNNRAEHNWLSFVTHVMRYKRLPDWVYQYKKPDS
ncbi:DUF6543 domain-containing protein [Pseudomonas sp. SWRI154]|uniref:dermonecrotic toxin domain-containing protein n=1 Tax=Pseudomonas sp. SWRI154 TaxID=2745501 RepID=UPI00164566EB|nr:DUF6543 domain-containing protein [Pseudomonas sp. SWRI154]MBC3363577.1 hypothetical protein [Pseudomonas sp. SWRI154]